MSYRILCPNVVSIRVQGIKFVHDGMFIKLASKDPYGIYGSVSKAAKSAAHEINSLQALIECNIANLHFPLQTIVDYLGRRLMMSSILPIDDTTLVRSIKFLIAEFARSLSFFPYADIW
jgi:hypothetical protein